MTSGIKTTLSYMKEYARERGCELLSENEKLKVKERTSFLCPCGSVFETNFDKFRGGQIICNSCSRKKVGNAIRNSVSDVLEDISRTKYFVLSCEYTDAKERNIELYDSDGYRYRTSLVEIRGSIKNCGSLERFSNTNPYTIDNIRNWIKISKAPYELVNEEYVYAIKRTLLLRCSDCHSEWLTCWAAMMTGAGCPYCCGKKINNTNGFGYLYPELLEEWDFEKNEVSPFEISPHSHKLVYWKCKSCSFSWKTRTSKRIVENTGCPKCNFSKGEVAVENILTEKHVDYFAQQCFLDCKMKRKPMTFDFYIPSKNIVIEFQGEQHYRPIDFAGRGSEWAEKMYKENIARDNFKREYCKARGIKMVEIPYFMLDQIGDIIDTEVIGYGPESQTRI
jgi:hypothetical protein